MDPVDLRHGLEAKRPSQCLDDLRAAKLAGETFDDPVRVVD